VAAYFAVDQGEISRRIKTGELEAVRVSRGALRVRREAVLS